MDSINDPEKLIKKTLELGMSGIAITDHECLGSHVIVNKLAKELKESNPDFTVALGNEIYLVDKRESGIKYYHFLLIAKDEIGYKALKELSSIAWYGSYTDRKIERVPTTKEELKKVMDKYRGHVIATTACIGGELSMFAKLMALARDVGDNNNAAIYYDAICDFVKYCLDIFGEDFYIECAPSNKADQIMVNKMLYKISQAFDIKMTVGTDAHYLTEKDRPIHKAYLTSKEGEREVDEFYEFARLMTPEECRSLLRLSYENDDIIDFIFDGSLSIQSKIEFYSLEKHQQVPEVEVKDYRPTLRSPVFYAKYPVLGSLYESNNIQERYWINQCEEALIQKGLEEDERYWERLEEEARTKRVIGEKLDTCMFAYPNTLQHYIDLFWNCGSIVGAGRGSACSGLNHYLLGITQLDPIEWDLPWYRYMNDERVELGDIDLDLAPSKRDKIFEKIREERGELGLIQVCTYGTEGTRSAIVTACRGYRSATYPNGIEVEDAQYMSSLVPQERGFSWTLKELVYGNADKGRRPQSQFVAAVNRYPGLLDIMLGIEGVVKSRGSHASGVILFDENIFDTCAIMKTPDGSLVTQLDLHDLEFCGGVKYDLETIISEKS